MKKKEVLSLSQDVSFPNEVKETLRDRILMLVGDRSIRVAAKAWGLSYSTLNNYLTRNTIPALNVAQSIAEIEGVSLDWLATGYESNENKGSAQSSHMTAPPVPEYLSGLISMMEILTQEEANQVLRVFKKKGVDLLLELTDETNLELLSLPMTTKKLAVTLKNYPESRVREIFSVDEMGEHSAVLNINKK